MVYHSSQSREKPCERYKSLVKTVSSLELTVTCAVVEAERRVEQVWSRVLLTHALQAMLPLQGLATQWTCGPGGERARHELVAAHAAPSHFLTLAQLFLFLFVLLSLSAFLFLLLFVSGLTLKTEESREVSLPWDI